MRILILTNLYPNPFQPHRANHIRRQVRELARNHDLRIIAPVLWTEEFTARLRGLQSIPLGRRVCHDGLAIDHPLYLYPPKCLRSWYGFCLRWSVRSVFNRIVTEFNPDIVYAPWAYPDGWAALHLARRTKLPVVIKVMGSDLLLLSKYRQREGRTLDALRKADCVVAVSRDLARRLTGYGVDPRKMRVVYDGVDPDTFYPGRRSEARSRLGLPDDVPIILFVGNLVAVKGLEVLLDACALLAKKGAIFNCLLIGAGPLRSQLERRASRLCLGASVRFPGVVPNDLLPDWYRAADVFVLPSHSEGVPNVLLETTACGTPFVASQVGGIPEIPRANESRLVAPNDATALAQALGDFVILRGAEHKILPLHSRTWADSAAELSSVFDDMLKSHVVPLSTR